MATTGPTALYRLFSAAGDLLYVGITSNVDARMRSHAADKPWWPAVIHTSVAWHPSRAEALATEAAVIAAELPRHNIQKMVAAAAPMRPGRRYEERPVDASPAAWASSVKALGAGLIPSVLRTPGYQFAFLQDWPAMDNDATVYHALSAQAKWHQFVCHPGKRAEVVISEFALIRRARSNALMAGQLDWLLAASTLSAVDIAVLPFATQLPAELRSDFSVYDEKEVCIEVPTGELHTTEAKAVARCVHSFDLLRAAGLRGSAATDFIRKVLASLGEGR